ncbi:alanine-glyoxylate transaminase/serine-glyoxylate transaminase/serine-pyruvate transaminase [Palleronia aestuarii]|uniref:Alanine-glyoxylate transaminase/serine-glyoxylate transaminase/serine-pyruvate transaminase n=1 Tax=Palleronia aestuarii TaxID=568105 RepID=A0A2W7NXQ6_9RHOB|nr:aminotransferase class V-fold PLP-dependent enzyme [Palleronia aestuarii]PZX15982.1 alanine-glyoxylate transaminase/serine-glyoxylate transaminase/serine-pyruvate transaminase [Palleronia aestuarii]
MSLANGRPYLAIPGPSVIPDAVLRAMHRAAPNIYTGELHEMMPELVADLKYVAQTEQHCAIYIANGHGGWEAALANMLSPGDAVLIPATGRFGHTWSDMSAALGVENRIIDFGLRSPIDAERVREALVEDREHRIKAVLTVYVDTSTGIRNDLEALRRVLDETGHPALLVADCIACMGCDRFEMDAWGVDVAITGSQKGLMTPPGLAFVFYNDKADRVRENARCVTHYWDWRPRTDPVDFYRHFDGTAPTHHLFALRAALDMIREEGLEQVMRRHAILARALWAAFDGWGAEGPIEINMADPAYRSHAVTAIRIGGDNGDRLRAWCEQKAGVTLGIGLGMAPPGSPEAGGFFRVGHMGHINAHMTMGLLGVIQAGLKALDIPHGPGGLDAAASVCAEA